LFPAKPTACAAVRKDGTFHFPLVAFRNTDPTQKKCTSELCNTKFSLIVAEFEPLLG